MAELLTESFCERCGTRYTFESAAPRRRLRGIKTLGSGLRTFVLSNDVSLDEAMAAARSDAERESSAHQLDAFHKTFSFCMTCRQYTCGDCWNAVEGRCLTCAPDPTRGAIAASFDLPEVAPIEAASSEVLSPIAPEPSEEPAWPAEASWTVATEPEGETDSVALEDDGTVVEAAGLETAAGPEIGDAAIPDLTIDEVTDLLARIGGHTADAEPEVEAPIVAEPEPALEPEPDVPVAAEVQGDADVPVATDVVEPAPDVDVASPTLGSTDDAAHRATGRTSALLARFRPGQSLDAAIAAYEAGLEPAEAPVKAAEPTIETAIEVEIEATPPDEPIEAPVAAAPPTPPAADSAPQPVWQAPAPSPADQPGPQWPTGARWPTAIPARGPAPQPGTPVDPLTALLAREASDRMWAASNAELASARPPAAASTPAVHECSSCGLSLSATARFCRRCGTRQGG